MAERKKSVEIVALRPTAAAASVAAAFGEPPPSLERRSLSIGGKRIASAYLRAKGS